MMNNDSKIDYSQHDFTQYFPTFPVQTLSTYSYRDI